ncbi:MAG: metallophosphoesterase [Verrucomicrobiota bacterium]
MLQQALQARPDAAFYIIAGDLVNRGRERDEWDSLFHYGSPVFSRRPLVPAVGNHDAQGGRPGLYLDQLELPKNGPLLFDQERVFALEYSNALFLVLDSNLRPHRQTAWLESQLGRSKALWKFVIYHHPAYSSARARDNADLREAWAPIFDRYHVDMALQGHDHAYLRTYPMRGQHRVESPAGGTTYVVAVSGTKMYLQDPRDYAAVALTNVATYQVLDLAGRRLTYRAFDAAGRTRDELVIDK